MIKVDNLSFKYSDSKEYALKNISLEIPSGKYVAIIGHNGSGKSTLSKLLVGLYKPTSGTIDVDDIRISRSTLKQIHQKISIVFQNPDNQFIGSTVEDDIAFGLENKRMPREKMKKVIDFFAEKVGMLDQLEKEPQNLSGGQKQRVAIASALALDTSIIIFDEITSMLDPKGKREVLKIISEIQKAKDKTLISITHDMDEAIQADLVVVFSNGSLVAIDTPQKILGDEKIAKLAKIEPPFIYKVSRELKSIGIEPTYSEKKLLDEVINNANKN